MRNTLGVYGAGSGRFKTNPRLVGCSTADHERNGPKVTAPALQMHPAFWEKPAFKWARTPAGYQHHEVTDLQARLDEAKTNGRIN